MNPQKVKTGDRIRVLQAPPDMEPSMPKETRTLIQRCVGKVLRVEGIADFGGLELLVLEDGTQAPDHCHHTIFIEPEHVEIVTKSA
jgi:hypothetical protein